MPSALPSTSPLPPGLRTLGDGKFIIQLTRQGRKLTRRCQGSRKQAERELEQAKLDLAQLLAAPPTHLPMPAGPPAKSASGAHSNPARAEGTVPTLREFLGEGGRFANYQRRSQSFRTQRKLVSCVRYLLASDLADLPLDKIGSRDTNSYVDWLMMEGALTFALRKDGARCAARRTALSASTINKSLRLLQTALRFAQEEEIISVVPRIKMLPETDAKRVHGPSREQYQRLIQGAQTLLAECPHLVEVIELIGEFGFRPGELFNLIWGSVELKHAGNGKVGGAVHVEEQGKRGFVPKEGKRRLIPMSPRGRAVLEKLNAARPEPRSPDDLVIPSHEGQPYIRLDTKNQKGGGTAVWKQLARKTGMKVSLYALRHYFAEQKLSAGVPLHFVSRWMGHSKVELTSKRYGHFAPDHADQWDYVAKGSTAA